MFLRHAQLFAKLESAHQDKNVESPRIVDKYKHQIKPFNEKNQTYRQSLDWGFNIHCLDPTVFSSYSSPCLPVPVFISLFASELTVSMNYEHVALNALLL